MNLIWYWILSKRIVSKYFNFFYYNNLKVKYFLHNLTKLKEMNKLFGLGKKKDKKKSKNEEGKAKKN